MNVVILTGRLTADPEVRTTQTGITIASYTLAVDRKSKDEKADFIRCKAFGKSADFAGKYLKKGTKIGIDGRIQTGSYTNQEGKTVFTTDVVVNSHEFCDSRKPQEGGSNASVDNLPIGGKMDGFLTIPDGVDEELPFR